MKSIMRQYRIKSNGYFSYIQRKSSKSLWRWSTISKAYDEDTECRYVEEDLQFLRREEAKRKAKQKTTRLTFFNKLKLGVVRFFTIFVKKLKRN